MNKLVLSCIFVMLCFFGVVFSANSFAAVHTYTGTVTGTIVVSGPSANGTLPFSEPMSFVVGDDRSFVFTLEGATFSTDLKSDGSFSGPVSFDIIDGFACTVTVNVAGTVNGKNSSGTVTGNVSPANCSGNALTLNSTFTASSPTEPNFGDESNKPKVVVIPFGDGLLPIVIPAPIVVIPAPDAPQPPANSGFLDEAIDKPIVWNQGWDTSIGHRTRIDPAVQIRFNGFTTAPFGPNGGYPAIAWTPNARIVHWGEQTYFNSTKRIYAKAVLLIDRGASVRGGAFEWVLDNQNFVIEHNMFRPGTTVGWLTNWYNSRPMPGNKVWFFLLSDDERFSSNPVSFIWQ